MESKLKPTDCHQLETLQNLLTHASPASLRDSLEDLLFTCMAEETVLLPSHEMVRHVYYLLLFLRELEKPNS